MIDALLMTTALMLPNGDSPSKPVQTASSDERKINLQRPSRGYMRSPIREAAEVPARYKTWATCVLRRESGGVLHNKQSREDARNGSSSASGRWQFLSAWQRGGSFMVRDRLVQFGVPKKNAKRVRQYLGNKPIYQWDGFFQDILFNEVVERGGAHHWDGHTCGRP